MNSAQTRSEKSASYRALGPTQVTVRTGTYYRIVSLQEYEYESNAKTEDTID
jgi:hypothetical protein